MLDFFGGRVPPVPPISDEARDRVNGFAQSFPSRDPTSGSQHDTTLEY
jgi:hypothetical protein